MATVLIHDQADLTAFLANGKRDDRPVLTDPEMAARLKVYWNELLQGWARLEETAVPAAAEAGEAVPPAALVAPYGSGGSRAPTAHGTGGLVPAEPRPEHPAIPVREALARLGATSVRRRHLEDRYVAVDPEDFGVLPFPCHVLGDGFVGYGLPDLPGRTGRQAVLRWATASHRTRLSVLWTQDGRRLSMSWEVDHRELEELRPEAAPSWFKRLAREMRGSLLATELGPLLRRVLPKPVHMRLEAAGTDLGSWCRGFDEGVLALLGGAAVAG